MKKLFLSASALLTSFSLFTGIIPFSVIANAINTESGVLDASDIYLEFGELESMSLSMEAVPKILAENDSYQFGDYLDANNTAVYKAFQKLVEPSVDEFTVTLPEPVSFKTSNLNSGDNEDFYNAVFTNCASGMEAASFDTPWIFWLDNNKTSVSAGNMKYTYNWLTKMYTFTIDKLTFSTSEYDGFASFEEVGEYKEKLQEAVDSYHVEGDTVAEKLRSIHDQICYFTEYDINGKFSGSALSAIVEPGAVCEGYSKGFKMLCDKIGVPAICVFGNFDETDSVAHMWNYVRMEDGYWYAVDVTWDDYDGSYGLELVDKYFLKGSDSFNVKHSPCNDYNLTHLEYPELAKHNYGEAPAVTVTVTTAVTTTTISTTKTSAAATVPTTSKTTPVTTVSTTKTSAATIAPTTSKTTPVTTVSTTKTSTAATAPTTSKTTPVTTVSTTKTSAAATAPTTSKTTPVTTVSTTKTSTSTTVSTAKKTTVTTTVSTVKTTVPVTTVPPVAEYEYGDLNRDGKVSIADLVYCASHVMGIINAENSCDVNNDGKADVYDVIIMRKLVAEKVAAIRKNR